MGGSWTEGGGREQASVYHNNHLKSLQNVVPVDRPIQCQPSGVPHQQTYNDRVRTGRGPLQAGCLHCPCLLRVSWERPWRGSSEGRARGGGLWLHTVF